MNLSRLLEARADAGNPVRVGLIGAGKFGAMYLAQALRTVGIHIMAIADLNVENAATSCRRTGWPEEKFAAPDFASALKSGATHITDDVDAMIAADGLEVVIDATGDPAAGIRHCGLAIREGRHIVMVNVEADVLAGPLLAAQAEAAGVVYSLAWGDQPALICEHVDWARTAGFKVVCAGKGTRYHPDFHQSTPDTVWDNFHLNAEQAARGGMNPKMFNSFIDGTKSGIEMSAVCNATGLTPQPEGLSFPPCSRYDLADVCKPRSAGGTVSHAGTTEVVSTLNRDKSDVENHLLMGTYVVIEAEGDYVRHCFEEYQMLPDESLSYGALYRPIHMIGLELGISVASAACRGEPTGAPRYFNADVAAKAKKALKAGDVLDGEGGYTVWGKQMAAADSLAQGALPLGLAHNVTLTRDIAEGEIIAWADVKIDQSLDAVRIRREMEARFARPNTSASEAAAE